MPLFNRIAVEFVPEGMTAEEARQQRARERGNRRMSNRDVLVGMGAIIGLVAIVAVPWLWFSSGSKAKAETGTELKYTPTAVAVVGTPTQLPTQTASPTPTTHHEKMGKQLLLDFNSPIQTPEPSAVAPVDVTPVPLPTQTPTATPTPLPPYQVLYTAVWTENNPGASYHVSGWVVESDGKTPRPVAMELCHQDGCMQYPRPGQNDIATGFYEFVASPGYYELKVKDTDGLSLPFMIYGEDGPARYEISFKFNRERPVSPARSNPWDSNYPTPTPDMWLPPDPTATPIIATATPDPDKPYRVFLPVIYK